MDLSGIISVSGMGGLYKVLSQTRNGLMIESLLDGKKLPVFSSHKISALEDISIYGMQDDIPLKEVFTAIKASKTTEFPEAKDSEARIKEAFAALLPSYDADRVYVSDMKKVFGWFQLLESKGMLEATEEVVEENAEGTTKSADKAKSASKPKPKEVAKNSAPKASTKGMAKTATVRKTGG
jgi:hypothetical protein